MISLLRPTIALTLLFPCACKSPPSTQAPGAAAGRRDLAGFSVVEIGGAIDAEVTAGQGFSVVITGDDSAVAKVRAKVQGETLVVGREDGSGKVHVAIGLPALHGVEAAGASHVVLAGLSGEGMRLGASGASDLRATNTGGQHLAIDASGASNIDIAGTVDDLVTDVSGASHVRAKALTVRKAVVDVSGASTLELNGKDVSGDASGASQVQVWGAPTHLTVETSGASSVKNMQ
jgi:hypothetical protein